MGKAKKEKKDVNPTETDVETTDAPAQADAAPDVESAPSAAAPSEVSGVDDRLLRLQADFDNYRKRTLREKSEWQLKANEDLLNELLPVLDHFELGLNTARKHHAESAVVDGFKMVYDQLQAALAKFQVQAISAEGQVFDPHWHEAITYVPSEEHPAGIIIAETRRGYRMGEKLLRAAQVVVSSGPADSGETKTASPAGSPPEEEEQDS